ncbi:TRASH domain-containing protein [Vulcanisaeta distributa]|uniref:Transcriptional regulator, TrmB n=1 Tax=Vulcanisaeta distributa (strain DSM 14429 / JCM 11212 / NBRC 100878 / IC-017) TaxID=572478 RepID=E1QP01_VULDI|nr:TRASH domain-containing protein [Vulcanisaeta distributa]ADN51366.1 transcriptional regulator, TrmB [Vulcanisaeta distributa DSM 14429]
MSKETTVSRFTDIEIRVLNVLRENARASVSEIAERLGVSRVTVYRALRSLINKGIKFTVDVPENSPRAFIITREPHADLGDCYKLVDGRYIVIVRARDFNELVTIIDGLRDKDEVYIALKPVSKQLISVGLVCDYCGGPITVPIIYRRGRRTYYLCCEACLRELKKKLSRSNKNKA